MERLKLYSKRWSTARGWIWKEERYCEPDTANDWLDYFKKAEPKVTFKLSYTKPKTGLSDKGPSLY